MAPKLNRKVSFAVVAIVAIVVCGCASKRPTRSAQGEAAQTAALADVTSVTYLFESAGSSEDQSNATAQTAAWQVRTALAAAGFKLVYGKSPPHDLTLRLYLNCQPERSAFRVVINGKEQVDYRVTAELAVRDGSTLVDSALVEFVADDGEVESGKLLPIVRKLSRSPAIASLARNKKTAAAQQAERVQAEQRKEAEVEAWVKTPVAQCAKPASLDACDGVRAFLKEHPNGAHAPEAEQALLEARPVLQQLEKDEQYWAKETSWQYCVQEPSQANCVGVELYRAKFPGGLHEDQARRLVEAAKAGTP